MAIFHFGGHAEADSLLAADGSVFVEGLADQLALQSQLQLVFLNGCNTQSQVKHFIRQDIPIVLATTCNIDDGQARYFASHFYRAIAERHSIQDAFQLAVGALKTRFEQYLGIDVPEALSVKRGLNLSDDLDQIPWQLYVQQGKEDFLNWRLRYPRGLTRLPSLQLETDCLGRDHELDQLRSLLNTSSKVVLVSGLGGMGKTTLAAGYLQWLRNDYDSIAWINSGNDLMASLAWNDDLAKNLEIPFVEKEKIEDRFARVMTKLRNQPGRNLLIIDDVNNQISDIATQLPSGGNWQVLVTSRQPLPDFQEMKLGILHPNDALRLFRLHFQEGTDEEVQALLVEISYHTLTIEVMAKTLNRLNGLLTVPELLAILQERKLDDPRLQELVFTCHAGEERAIFFHLMKAFELAKLPKEELWLMQQYAVLPAIPIEVKTLAELLQKEPLALNRLVNELNDQGWIGKLGKGLGMHKMIQEVVIYQKEPGMEELDDLVKSLTAKMDKTEFGNPVIDNFPWAPYADKVAVYFETGKTKGEKLSILWNNLAIVNGDLGNYKRATELLENALQDDLHFFGPNHPNVSTRQSNLGVMYRISGNYTRAAELLEQALNSELQNFGQQHPNVARCQSNLALVYQDIGNYTRAADLLEQALQSDLDNFGPQHPIVAIRQSNLAVVHQALGDFTRAAELFEQALQSYLHNLGKQHPNIAIIQSNLALVYRDLGNYNRAAELLEEALQNDSDNYGLQHPNVARCQSNLALVYQDLGDFQRAVELFEQALQSYLHNFGPQHPNVAGCQSNLALVYQDLGDYTRAAELSEKALQNTLQTLGNQHPTVAKIQSNLGLIYYNLKDYTRAAQLLKKALQSDTENFGSQHPNVARCQSNLALVYQALGDYSGAVELLEQALQNDLKNFGPHHPNIALNQSNLATVYHKLGKYLRAAELLEQALQNDLHHFGSQHPNVARCKHNLATIYFNLGRMQEAKILMTQALQIYEKSFGVDHPNCAIVLRLLKEVEKRLEDG